MKQLTIELLNSLVEMYYMETGQSLESITIDEYSFKILQNNLYTVIGKPKQLELYTSTGKLIIKCSQVESIKKIKQEIELLQKQLKELQEFENK
jgi:urocanate hydratase